MEGQILIEQIESLAKLIIKLCEEFDIPKVCTETNVYQNGIENFKGVVSKSSFNLNYKDLNPSFDFKLLQNLLE
jgi:hypothetical protein